jgi:hypothetical protein
MSTQAYRRHAADCLKLSMTVSNPTARALLRRMAVAWTDLAEQAEKNQQNDTVYEPPERVVQQQQQPQNDRKD